MIDVRIPGTPGWWFARLCPQLMAQRAHHEALASYRDGTNAVPTLATRAARESYARLMRMSGLNLAELSVEATRERMTPIGFRTGAEGDKLADARAHRIWQANHLDADIAKPFRSKMTGSVSYMSVGPADGQDVPLILPESPRMTVTEQDPRRSRVALAALKMWTDYEAGIDWAYVFTPGWVHRAARAHTAPTSSVAPQPAEVYSPSGFEWVDRGQQLPELVGNRVPIVRFPNNEDDDGRSWGEYERHTAILDRISFSVLQRLEIATLQAFRQRAIKGTLPQVDPMTNQPIDYGDVFSAAPGALWQLPDGVDVWESGVVDLGPIRSAVRDDVTDFAAATRTPLFYITPDAANGSAEGASLSREGLLFKVRDRIREADEAVEQVMSLAFAFDGDAERASLVDLEVIWESPDRQTMAERYDAAVKAKAAGVPWATTMRDVLGFSPAEVSRMEVDRVNELALDASFLSLPAASVPTPTV